MPKVVTTISVVIGTPLVDSKGKPVMEKVKWNGREKEHHAHENTQYPANSVIDVDDELAKELIQAGHARDIVVGLDEDVSPIKTIDPLA